MKKAFLTAVCLSMAITFQSCEKYLGSSTVGGDLSPMGEVGTTYSSTSATVGGVSSLTAVVVSVDGKTSVLSGSATVTNATVKDILSKSDLITISGNEVTATNVKFKSTTEGLESVKGLDPGIIVKYDAEVGDKYETESGKTRTVKSVSTENDYPYGFMNIKVIQVEEVRNVDGIKKIRYWANHKWGLVAVEFTLDDDTTAKFPIYCSTNN
ncbi:MAG: hypothetical protein PHY99_11260 [Bacteroidales bacterium]|nr:hypothetical protein [Bacteroidales bacterium]